MQPVAHVADSRQQDAARQMGERQRVLEEQIRRQQELDAYREEYARRFEDGAEGMMGLHVREYRLFLARLNQAAEEQARNVERAQQALERSQGDWTRCRIHSDAVHKVIDRMQVEERDEDVRREQSENDEFGQRPRRRDL